MRTFSEIVDIKYLTLAPARSAFIEAIFECLNRDERRLAVP